MKHFILCSVAFAFVNSSGAAAELSQPRVIKIGAKQRLSSDAQFSLDGRLFVSTSTRYNPSTVTFRAWSAQTTAPFAQWNLRTLQQFALAPSGRTVAVITGERQRRGIGIPYAVELRDIHSGKVKRTIIRAGAIGVGIYSLSWSSDGRFLATGSGDGLARVWDLWAGKRIASLRADGYVGALQFSFDGKLLATVGEKYDSRARVKLWNWKQKKQLGTTGFGTYSNYATLTFSPDGKYLAVGNTSIGKTSLLDIKKLQQVLQLPAPSQVQVNSGVPVPKVAFSRDGKFMAFVSGSEVIVRNTTSTRASRRYTLKQKTGPHVLALQFSPKGHLRWVTVQYQYQEDKGIGTWGLVAPTIWNTRL